MHKFISQTLRYPADAVERNAQGLVVYTFIVEKDGTLTNFDLIHRADSSLNKEALRILRGDAALASGQVQGSVCTLQELRADVFPVEQECERSGRNTTTRSTNTIGKTNPDIANSEVYSIVEKMPEYPYGRKSWQDLSPISSVIPRRLVNRESKAGSSAPSLLQPTVQSSISR